MKSYRFIISGKVQSVYYRKTIKENATKSKFNGYIKNLPNGTVEAVVTCDDGKLDDFIAMLRRGSRYSKIAQLKQSATNEVYTNGFIVKY